MKRINRKLILIIILIFTLLVAAMVLLEYRIGNIRSEISVLTANSCASSAVTHGIDTALAAYKVNYNNIVNFTYDSDGNIKSISADIITLNNLGNRIGDGIDSEFNSVQSRKIKIPLTSLLGGEITSGVGPCIPLHITMGGITMTKFENNFESCGVNQTRHQIILNVTVNTYVINAGKVQTVVYKSNVCIAESIIVGVTPQTFAEISR